MGVDNLSEFQRILKDWSRNKVPEQINKAQKKLAIDALSSLVLLTPVDTGRARGNWQVSIGAPIDGPVEELDKTGQSTIQAGTAIIQAAQPFLTIFITNNVEYIEYLEKGTDKIAPVGMLTTTIENLKQVF